jgi:lysophospholipase L1-like esterase
MVTATSPERWDVMRMGPRTRARVERGIAAFNRVTRRTAAAHDVACLDLCASPALSRPENFSPDGLHPSPLGHQYAARGFARLLRERFGLHSETEAERARRENEEE